MAQRLLHHHVANLKNQRDMMLKNKNGHRWMDVVTFYFIVFTSEQVFAPIPKAVSGIGIRIHVLPGANYAGFSTNQTLCQVISVFSISSLVEANQ